MTRLLLAATALGTLTGLLLTFGAGGAVGIAVCAGAVIMWFGVRAVRRDAQRERDKARHPSSWKRLPCGIEFNLTHHGWHAEYRADWHHVRRNKYGLRPGHWARGDDGEDYWLTGTPEWDRQWFKTHGMRVPPIGDPSRTYWFNHGHGLRQLAYHAEVN